MNVAIAASARADDGDYFAYAIGCRWPSDLGYEVVRNAGLPARPLMRMSAYRLAISRVSSRFRPAVTAGIGGASRSTDRPNPQPPSRKRT